MKSPEVYSYLKSELAPWFKDAGFKRSKGLLSWTRPHGDVHIVIWCQISQDGWDAYAGSKFIVEFQLSPESVYGASGRRERFACFLSYEERERVRFIQNEVIQSLHRPPSFYPVLQISEQVTEWYLSKFEPVSEPYPERHDIWLRYSKPEHVIRWGRLIVSKLPECVGVVEGWANPALEANGE